MKSKIRSLLVLSVAMTVIGAGVWGCSQADNPTPVKAEPPPAPKPEELKVPKNKATKSEYGAGARYKKAMNKGE
ncbi:MAG: hypothetical protein ACLQGP_00195 [Isosphaeraceae bacterium]